MAEDKNGYACGEISPEIDGVISLTLYAHNWSLGPPGKVHSLSLSWVSLYIQILQVGVNAYLALHDRGRVVRSSSSIFEGRPKLNPPKKMTGKFRKNISIGNL